MDLKEKREELIKEATKHEADLVTLTKQQQDIAKAIAKLNSTLLIIGGKVQMLDELIKEEDASI